MNLSKLQLVLVGVSGLLPSAALAQTAEIPQDSNLAKPPAALGGSQTIDVIVLKSSSPGVPLRYGAVYPESERVDFEGKILKRGVDYQVDYEAGVVYLMRPQKAGQTVVVSYVYDGAKQPKTNGQFGGVPAFKLDFLEGGLKMVGGFGMTERLGDGNVLTSNLYGINNSLRLGSGSLRGVMMVGERTKQDLKSGFEYQDSPGATQDGKSRALLQNYSSAILGGSVELNYQDISKNFAGIAALRDAGLDADQLAKERGLVRSAFSLKDLSFGGLKVSNGFKSVKDGQGEVDWRSFGFAGHGLEFNWNAQAVGEHFNRFRDLAEGDREQLLREAGLSREKMSAKWSNPLGGLSYNASQVEDLSGNGIYRRETGLDVKGGRVFTVGDQNIDAGFSKFGNLFEPEKAQWGKEAGLRRQWLALDTAVLGHLPFALKYDDTSLRSTVGVFASKMGTLSGTGWSLQHTSKGVSSDFGNMGSLSQDEMDKHIRDISTMYQKDGSLWRPEERNWLINGRGIQRTFTRFSASPSKGFALDFNRLELKGRQDGGQVDTFSLNSKGTSVEYRREKIGEHFDELNSLMGFEKQRLGSISGLDRSDFGLRFQFGKNKNLGFNTLDASMPDGSASRRTASYSDGKIDVVASTREVDSGFNQVGSLVDPEKDLLNSLKGFKERDIKAKWQIAPNLTFDLFRFEARNDTLNQDKYLQNTAINWKPDKKTELSMEQTRNKSDDPLQVLFAQFTDRLAVMRDFGRLGILRYQRQSIDFDGRDTDRPDSKLEYVALETKLNQTTNLKAERSLTTFDNGDKEDISSNTVSTELNKKAGVSVTDVKIDRNGDERDERKQNYGFWYDFGKGMRLSYGYVRQMNGANGTLNSNFIISPGTLGLLQINNASYGENRWDGSHSQGFSNLQLTSSRPFRVGMFRDLQFTANSDTASDWTNFIRENRQLALSGKFGSNVFGFEYRSQVDPTGEHGIDRTLSFTTDQSDKNLLKANLVYKARKLPTGAETMIRNFKFSAKAGRNLQVTNELLTNPEIARGDVILGSVTDPWRVNRWKLDLLGSTDTLVGATWEEKRNDYTHELSRLTGMSLSLFNKSGSPLSLFYGIEEVDGALRRRTNRYWLRFDQRPGVNQLMSLYLGNVSYEHSVPDGQHHSNWTLRADYRLKF